MSSPQHEPTMEEILASIRKIISEDSPEPGPAQTEPAAEVKAAQDAEVLDLTHEVHEEPPPVVAVAPAPMAAAPAVAAPVVEAPAPVKPADDVVFETIEEATVSSQAPLHSSEGIFSDKTRKALSDAFAEMTPPPAVPSVPGAVPSVGSLSVESVFERAVRESFDPVLSKWLGDNADEIVKRMKPAIAEWLDEHMPTIIEEELRAERARQQGRRRS